MLLIPHAERVIVLDPGLLRHQEIHVLSGHLPGFPDNAGKTIKTTTMYSPLNKRPLA